MAKRKQTQDSQRWPRSFANMEAAQRLVGQPGWALLVTDLKEVAEGLSYRLAHEVVTNMDMAAEQNSLRGILNGIERVIEFEEDLKEWREQNK